jgi:hypothetical protein
VKWVYEYRPGYFGRKRGFIHEKFNEMYGPGRWRIVWNAQASAFSFEEACLVFYEKSYDDYLSTRSDLLDFICSFGECIDNAITNIQSGCDYTKQESYSTHIQDIAVRNVLKKHGFKFRGSPDKILTIRGADSNGYHFAPGNIPFYDPRLIAQPSLAPKWAQTGSVEDFWQSNKWLQILADSPQMDLLDQS